MVISYTLGKNNKNTHCLAYCCTRRKLINIPAVSETVCGKFFSFLFKFCFSPSSTCRIFWCSETFFQYHRLNTKATKRRVMPCRGARLPQPAHLKKTHGHGESDLLIGLMVL